jgi:putative transcriptional regulator
MQNRCARPLLAALAVVALVAGCDACRTGLAREEASEAPAAPLSDTSPDSLAAGRFLIATRQVEGLVFGEAVVLLLDHGEGGALGLVVNRRTNVRLAELLPEIADLREKDQSAYLGGPVEIDTLRVLLRADEPPEGALRVVADVFTTASEEALRRAVARRDAARRVRAYLGYAGWAAGQLEAEVERGDWYVAAADPEAIFSESPEQVWESLVREHEGVRAGRDAPGIARLAALGGHGRAPAP